MSAHVFSTMGTVVSLRVDEGALDRSDRERVESVFHHYDRVFSLYDDASALSRVARGELSLESAGAEVLDAYALAIEWRNKTAGAFTPHRPDGVIDLSGVVKALAIDEAGRILDDRADDWLLTVGGDVLARGRYEGHGWRVGIVDPAARDRLAGLVELSGGRRAVATSGSTERGDHIWKRGSETYRQVTVVADDIVTADVLATAIAAGTPDDLDAITAAHAIDVVAFDRDLAARATPGAYAWVA